MSHFLQDLRYAYRMLLKNIGFTVVVVGTLALGIGANTAVFSVVNAVLLRPLPYQNPERLVRVLGTNPKLGFDEAPVSPLDFVDYQSQNKVFENMSAYWDESFNLTTGDKPETVEAGLVTANFFSTLGTKMALGRGFLAEEERPGSGCTAVLSQGFWRRRLGSDAGIIGKTISLNGVPCDVVGVTPSDFQSLTPRQELWVPIVLDGSDALRRPAPLNAEELKKRRRRFLTVIARLKEGVTNEQAREEMKGLARQLEQQYPDQNTDWSMNTVSLHEQIVGDIRQSLLILFGAVGFVLLIACTNIANLMIARAATRVKEIAIRTALGASRLRTLQQLLTESLLLGILGGLLSLLLAYWGISLLVAAGPDDIPRLNEIRLDGVVLAFTLLLSVLTGIFFGLFPAFKLSRPNLNELLKEGGRDSAGALRSRVRNLLVVSEVALALVLLIAAGLMIKSLWNLGRVNPGFESKNLLTMSLSLSPTRYSENEQKASFYKRLLQQVETVPGVESVAATSVLPLSGGNAIFRFNVEGRAPASPTEVLTANYRAISPGYFQTIGVPMRQGRDFSERDTDKAPGVVIINESMARKYFSGENPVGKRLTISFGEPAPREIVAVVGDVKHSALDKESGAEMYVPYLQTPWAGMTLVLRTQLAQDAVVRQVTRELQSIDKDQPISRIRTVEQLISESISERSFSMYLLMIFAALALVLAGVGIYGMLAYSVTQRKREIGIRMALGAQRRDIFRLVVGQGVGLTLIGTATGLFTAFVITRVMSSLLYGVSSTDLSIFLGTACVLFCVALLASFFPARRAVKVNPIKTLRE